MDLLDSAVAEERAAAAGDKVTYLRF